MKCAVDFGSKSVKQQGKYDGVNGWYKVMVVPHQEQHEQTL